MWTGATRIRENTRGKLKTVCLAAFVAMNLLYIVVAVFVLVIAIWLLIMLIRSLPVLRIQGPLAPVLWAVLLIVVVAILLGVTGVWHPFNLKFH